MPISLITSTANIAVRVFTPSGVRRNIMQREFCSDAVSSLGRDARACHSPCFVSNLHLSRCEMPTDSLLCEYGAGDLTHNWKQNNHLTYTELNILFTYRSFNTVFIDAQNVSVFSFLSLSSTRSNAYCSNHFSRNALEHPLTDKYAIHSSLSLS